MDSDVLYLYARREAFGQISSTRMITNDTGAVAYSAAHGPYGAIEKTWTNSYDPALKFSGKEREKGSGLDYFGARYYGHAVYRFIPAALVLAMQFLEANPRFLSGETRETEWIFAPFAVWSYHTPGIPLSLVRSLLLPALILILLFPAVKKSLRFKLALGVFFMSLIPVILLAERSGAHLNMSGNFFWGAHMALFVLMMESLILLAGQNRLKFKPLFAGVIALHVLSGLIYVSRLAVGLPF